MSSTAEAASEIHPFRVDVPDEALDDLRRRIEATQWPEKETVPDDSQGVPLATMQKLARYGASASGGYRDAPLTSDRVVPRRHGAAEVVDDVVV